MSNLVKEAVKLYFETLPLSKMPLNNETSCVWHDLYSKECKLYELLREMDDSQKVEYRDFLGIEN